MKKITIAALALITLAACNSEDKNEKTLPQQEAAKIREENTSVPLDSITLNSYVVFNDSSGNKRPAVLVIPEWWGLNDYAKTRARQLAEMGYVAMALDMYGDGKTAANPEEAGKLAGPFYGDPQMGKSRIDAAIAKLKTYPQVDSSRIAAIGYCFGGSMVLNSAKLGSDLKGVVSFHGGLQGPAPDKNKMKAAILVCHGAADSFVPDKDSANFRNQLDAAGANYSFKSYAHSKHAFTNPEADENGKKFGIDIAYNKEADEASWKDMKAFLEQLFK